MEKQYADRMNEKYAQNSIIILAVFGMLITSYLAYIHATKTVPVCLVGAVEGCATVLESSYSKIGGIPVVYAGLLTWTTLFILGMYGRMRNRQVLQWIFLFSTGGLFAAGYFNGIMLTQLKAICVWCEASHVLMISTFVVSGLSVQKKRYVLGSIGIFVFAIAFSLAFFQEKPTGLAVFAQCLTQEKVVMYGAYWCPHCKNQKLLFGDDFKHITYVECALPDKTGQTRECIEANVTKYPTWQLSDGTRISGEITLEELQEKTACQLQENN